MGMVVFEVIVNVLQVRCGGGRPADTHFLRAQHLLYAGIHFLFFYKLAPIGLCDTFPHQGTKPGIAFEQAQGCLLHQSLGVGACVGGKLRELRFLLGREMYFHALQSKGKSRFRQARLCDSAHNGGFRTWTDIAQRYV